MLNIFLSIFKEQNQTMQRAIHLNMTLDRGDGSYLTSCRLEYGNGISYPEVECDSESKVRIFNDLMSYSHRKNNYNTGTQLNLSNYNSLYTLIYFDLTYQTERVTRCKTADIQL